MSILETIETPGDSPVICTILGDSGMGKTSLAATFEKPIFIRAEDGLQAIPLEIRPKAFPKLATADDLWDQLSALIREDHEFKTVVIDSVTALERLFIDDVIKGDDKNPKSINQALGGYGAGLAAVAALHGRVRKAIEVLRDKRGMNCVFIAHADTETLDLPDCEAYTRYTLRLGKKSLAPYVDDVDLVGFIKLRHFLKEKESGTKTAISDGSRILCVNASAACISKNRYGIKDDIDVIQGENPLKQFIKTLN